MKPKFSLPWLPLLWVFLWLLVLFIPPLRRQRWEQTRPSLGRVFKVGYDFNIQGPELSGLPPGPMHDWLAATPTNVGSIYTPTFTMKLKKVLPVLERYPKENWIRAGVLRMSTRVPLFTGALPWDLPPTTPQPNREPWFTASDTLTCLKVAQDGAKAEPDNAFFPLIEALYHLVLKRKSAAWRALDQVARCPRFDDYATAEMWQRLKFEGADQNLIWEERFAAHSAVLLPHYISLKTVGRYARWEGWQALRAGNKRVALDRLEESIAVARALRRDRTAPLALFVGSMDIAAAWRTPANSGNFWRAEISILSTSPLNARQVSAAPAATFNIAAQPYIRFVRSQGRPDLVPGILRDANDPVTNALLPNTVRLGYPGDIPTLVTASQGYFLSTILAYVAWGSAGLWLLLGLTKRFNLPEPSRRVVSLGALLAIVMASILLGFVFASSLGDICNWLGSSETEPPGEIPAVERAFAVLAAGITVLPVWLWRIRVLHSESGRDKVRTIRKKIVLSRAVKALLVLWPFGVASLIFALTYSGPLWAGTILAPPIPLAAGVLTCSGAAMLTFHTLAERRARRGGQRFSIVPWLRVAAYAPGMLRSVAGVVAMAATVSYLIAVVTIWPARARMERYWDDVEARGQVAVWVDRVKAGR